MALTLNTMDPGDMVERHACMHNFWVPTVYHHVERSFSLLRRIVDMEEVGFGCDVHWDKGRRSSRRIVYWGCTIAGYVYREVFSVDLYLAQGK